MHVRSSTFVGLALLASACGVEDVELRPPGSTSPASAAGSDAPVTSGRDPRERQGAGVATPGVANDTPADGVLYPVVEVVTPGGIFDFDKPEPEPPVGCNKVDFLFVVDNSLSMFQEQSNLVASFPGFMSVIGATVEATDFHIMVIDTDGRDADVGDPAGSCEDTLGAGKRLSSGDDECGVLGVERYMQEAQPDLTETFSCVAQVGTFGNLGQHPMDALFAALSPVQNTIGGCNAGFLRDDAILVVTLISDEDDTRSSGDPEVWRDALVTTKSGDAKAVVVLGLVGDNNVRGGLPGGPCGLFAANGAPALQRFVQSLPYGTLASVCASNYAPFFEQAVSVIDGACKEFVPPIR